MSEDIKNYQIKTNEVDIDCHWVLLPHAKDKNQRVTISILAKGDLPHHVIEGICDSLKKVQENNCHLKDFEGDRCPKCEQILERDQ